MIFSLNQDRNLYHVSGSVRIHRVPFDLTGTYTDVRRYTSGDLVNCGGALYHPIEIVGESVRMEAVEGGRRHEAWMYSYNHKPEFWCS